MNVSLTIMAAEEVSLTHAFGSEEALADWEFINIAVLDRCPCTMSHKLEDKGDLLVGVLRCLEIWFEIR